MVILVEFDSGFMLSRRLAGSSWPEPLPDTSSTFWRCIWKGEGADAELAKLITWVIGERLKDIATSAGQAKPRLS